MEELVEQAREAREAAYAPYSEYNVGAALKTEEGDVYTGCNIEIANFSNTLHAEEVAVGAREPDAVWFTYAEAEEPADEEEAEEDASEGLGELFG